MVRAFLKLAVSLALLSFLLWRLATETPDAMASLAQGPASWSLLLSGWGLLSAAYLLGTVRWFVLLRSAGQIVQYRAVLQASVTGFMFDFIGFGAVGGDVAKLLVLKQRVPEVSRAAVLGAVLVDRIAGLCGLLGWAAAVYWATGFPAGPLEWLGWVACLGTGGIAVGFPLIWALGRSGHSIPPALGRVPYLGEPLLRLVRGVLDYGGRPRVIAVAMVFGLVALAVNVAGFYLLAQGLSAGSPTFLEQSVMVPYGLLAGVIPLPADALGAMDYAMVQLYASVPESAVSPVLAVGVVMAYRAVGVVLSGLGAWLYLHQADRQA